MTKGWILPENVSNSTYKFLNGPTWCLPTWTFTAKWPHRPRATGLNQWEKKMISLQR